MIKQLLRSSLLAGGVLALGIVGMQSTQAQETSKSITYLHGPWSQGLAVSNVARLMLEKIGYKVEMKLLDTALVYQALASGDGDLFSSAYLPGQQVYLNKHEGKLDVISISYGPLPGGLAVPGYVNVDSIEDLKKPEVAELFKGQILGQDAGAGVMRQTETAIKNYGLDMKLVSSSMAAMTAAFQSAYEKQEPIVIVNNCPHYLCAKYNIKFLADPQEVYGEARDFHIARAGFREEHPDAAKLLSRLTIFGDQLSEMLVWMEADKLTAEQAAARFIEEHPDLVWYWAGDLEGGVEMPEMLKAMN